MIVLKDYDGYRYPSLTHPTTYLGIARESYSRLVLEAEMPESSFAQGATAYYTGKTPQKSVFHLQVEGTLDPIARSESDRPYILKGAGGLNLQIDGDVHSGNCYVVSKKGDAFVVSECWTKSIEPLFSIFDVWTLRREDTTAGNLVVGYKCICLWQNASKNSFKYSVEGSSSTSRFRLLDTYDLGYLKERFYSAAANARIHAIEHVTTDSGFAGYLLPYSLLRYSADVEAYYRSLLPKISREIQFVASITRRNAYNIDPMKEARMGWLADAAIQGNLFFVRSNMLEFWIEALQGTFGAEIKSWAEAMSSFSKNRKNSTAKVAQAYVATTYGTQLTLNDVEQWQNAITKYMWKSYDNARAFTFAKAKSTHSVSRPSAALQDGSCDYNYSLCYDPLEKFGGSYGVKELLDSFRLSPNAKRTWEIIPLSFVVDWFLPISDLFSVLESEDTLFDMKYRTFGETSSSKYAFPFAKYPTLSVVLYSRTCSKRPFTIPLPDLEDLNPLNRGVSGSAAINGTALILSGKRAK